MMEGIEDLLDIAEVPDDKRDTARSWLVSALSGAADSVRARSHHQPPKQSEINKQLRDIEGASQKLLGKLRDLHGAARSDLWVRGGLDAFGKLEFQNVDKVIEDHVLRLKALETAAAQAQAPAAQGHQKEWGKLNVCKLCAGFFDRFSPLPITYQEDRGFTNFLREAFSIVRIPDDEDRSYRRIIESTIAERR